MEQVKIDLNECINLFELEKLAKEKMSKLGFDYYAGGATDEITLKDNIEAYRRIKLRPRMLRDVSKIETDISLLGSQSSTPILVAPMAFQKLACDEGELAMAKAAKSKSTIMCVSTLATHSLEEVKASGGDDLWFQLYVYKDKSITKDLLERAYNAGYKAVVMTVDSPVLGKREKDIKNCFTLPKNMEVKNLLDKNLENFPLAQDNSGLAEYIDSLYDRSLTYKDLEWICSESKLPVLVKGILREDDALKAISHGAKGIVVSNHGGRQLDTTISTIEAFREVANAVKGRVPLLVDGGIRRGVDVLKALALGADAVLLGRPLLWGLAIEGTEGAQFVLETIQAEFENAMILAGCTNISEITSDLIFN